MNTSMSKSKWGLALVAAGMMVVLASCTSMRPMMMMGEQKVTLSGANEVPPVTTTATGTATVTIKDDRSVVVLVTFAGMTATASHIHMGPAGTIGPVIVPFVKTSDNTFASSAGAKLTEEQYAAYKAGNLYVNVHTAQNPVGEIRGQLKGN